MLRHVAPNVELQVKLIYFVPKTCQPLLRAHEHTCVLPRLCSRTHPLYLFLERPRPAPRVDVKQSGSSVISQRIDWTFYGTWPLTSAMLCPTLETASWKLANNWWAFFPSL